MQGNTRLWKYRNYFTAVLLIYNSIYIRAQGNQCPLKSTCRECIQYSDAECTWCSDVDYTKQTSPLERCNSMAKHKQQNCSNIINPLSNATATKNEDLTNTTKVKPQEVVIALRPGQKREFDISVRTPENYPVDVYMLMDMSYSMKDNLKSVETLGLDLGKEMLNITSRFRVGFGTMVDKPMLPFSQSSESYWIKQGQKDKTRPFSSPWVFRNALSLTENTDEFEASVKSSNLSGSIDGPDGWVDTLMQVAVCEKAVNWSPKESARRLVVITTEADFHIAGDGLLGGLVQPSDGRCKLGSGDTYFGKETDYPSISYLRKVLLDNSIVPIFAVDSTSIDIYKRVARYFGRQIGSEAGILYDNSTNIVQLIRNTYEKIGTTQTVFHNEEDTKDLKIEYTAHCLNGSFPGTTCENVAIGETVRFTVSVSLEKCPAGGMGYTKFFITTALGDKIPVKVTYLCDCDCTNMTVHNSTECSEQGSLTCGDCVCNDGYLLDKCDCPDSRIDEHNEKCRASNSSSICSNAGRCYCGKCECDKRKEAGEGRSYGEFCQCNDQLCESDEKGQICGGEERGYCDCNKCSCFPGWEGPSCSCRNVTTACIQNNVTCSGRGQCECGLCICEPKFSGTFCETCDGCIKGCSYYKDCVRCKIYQTGPLTGDCEKSCNATITKVDNVESHEGQGTTCVEIDDDDDCTFSYVLIEGSEKVQIYAEEEKRCPREEGYLLIIIGVILGIVAIGAALLLIWKLLATIQDRREFAKFEREQQNARWDTSENPIFKQATTTFQNPTYGGKG
ncbi:integrin beta-1-A-like [Dendronephthya gigantea]|uniref:integrin beta-1-A-like n=1 Tax=Dendronephthya gigantea TaxID=151771 RepID=UPI00106A7E2A|nr:integrin beta-1-A-like [Dendronephthya gigantea]